MKQITKIIFLIGFCALSQAQQIRRGTLKDYSNFDYTGTIEVLEKLANKKNPSPDVFLKLADAYYNNGKMDEAARWYERLLNTEAIIDPEIYFKQSIALKTIGKYEAANESMLKFTKVSPQDSRAIRFLSSKDYLDNIVDNSAFITLKNLDINTPLSDFGGILYDENLIFASSRDESEKIYKWNDQPFLDLFELSTDGAISEIQGDINTKYHESSAAFTRDGKTMYFTRNNYYKKRLKGDENNSHRLKIYKAKKVDGTWTNVESLPFNSDDYSTAHPALSPDGKTLYFASDMPGSLGSSDIFKVAIIDDDIYGNPVNLGSKINTEGRENFPYVSKNGTLYFSSNGHIGLGGLDVYEVERKADDVQIKNILNVGRPINSSYDDFSFFFNDKALTGYITSNRPGGKGDDDIYSFAKTECTQNLFGIVKTEAGELLDNATIILTSDNNAVSELQTDEKGSFEANFKCESRIIDIVAAKEGYEEDRISISLEVPKSSYENTTEARLTLKEKTKVAAIGTDLFNLLDLQPIYFDYDKSFIRNDAAMELEKIINYMKEFPSVKIEVKSHTDARGNDSYNLALSERRNAATKAYLIEQGNITPNRLSGRGYGETQLTNNCSNNVPCAKEDHQANRRSEFIIIEN
ncbi:flagellar motor protein MotB [Dokdonia sinensis]|uniref:Flagellar motor protein MotB n=1 Tax=Dokdonia sinensis TaxID=2479847 RepID=A0A3M0G4G8_9FLAO|nr:OmpA family protein [Dokdonia sinensis]RMB56059.1 flagellar motor protein MotB [Dokdonia sinensis]